MSDDKHRFLWHNGGPLVCEICGTRWSEHPSFDDEDEIERLEAEVAALTAENARLARAYLENFDGGRETKP